MDHRPFAGALIADVRRDRIAAEPDRGEIRNRPVLISLCRRHTKSARLL
jgi:hypothetical protein